ncbi:MAG: YhgE/Pip domain-containing protein [Actinomycetaceae bacterium]|nr:YhgE/Pip domain-containing protein [Actinomycetaceae bacterium]
MRNVLRVVNRDVKRVVRVPQSWIIIIGVILIPSLYAWFNIMAFWDPYGATGNISVAVANSDAGAKSELTGFVNLGPRIESELKKNDQLGWDFMSEDDALAAVNEGRVFAAIVIPQNFTSDVLGVVEGDFKRPQIDYYVNEKLNAVSPKITDVGASTLESRINQQFVNTVSKVVSERLRDAGIDFEKQLSGNQNGAISSLKSLEGKLNATKVKLGDSRTQIRDASDRLDATYGALDSVYATLEDAAVAAEQAGGIARSVTGPIMTSTGNITDAYVRASGKMSEVSAKATESSRQITAILQQANDDAASALDVAKRVSDITEESLEELQGLVNQPGVDSEVLGRLSKATEDLQQRHRANKEILSSLESLNSNLSQTHDSSLSTVVNLDKSVKASNDAGVALNQTLAQDIPRLQSQIMDLGRVADAVAVSLRAEQPLVTQSQNLASSIQENLNDFADSLSSFESNIDSIQTTVSNIRTDLSAISAADSFEKLTNVSNLEPQEIATFLSQPVQIDEHVIFPLKSYGSAMAALFTNLTLWIGAFVLVVIFRLDVDSEGFTSLSHRTRYWARWLFFAILATCQAILVSVGNFLLGVQMVNPFIFTLTAILNSLCYLSIIYALSTTLGYVGKGICILLVIMQIPGSSGLYPIEMMPGFFRALYPLLPFTYGIDAMREATAGFAGNIYYLSELKLLAGSTVLLLFGIQIRRVMRGFNATFNSKLEASDLLTADGTMNAKTTKQHFQFSRVMVALANSDNYRTVLLKRSAKLNERFHAMLVFSSVLTVAVIGVVGVLGYFGHLGKASILGLWVIIVLVFVSFIVIEDYRRDWLSTASSYALMGSHEIRDELFTIPSRLARRSGARPELLDEQVIASKQVDANEQVTVVRETTVDAEDTPAQEPTADEGDNDA